MNETEDRSAAHREGWDLMAWVVGGSATAQQRQTFDAHVRDCVACREEYEFQCRVRDALAQGWPEPAGPGGAWARLSQRLDEPDEGDASLGCDRGAASASHRPARAGTRPGPSSAFWWRGLVAVVVVQAIGLVALGGALWSRSGPEAAYRTLSSAPARPAATVRLVPAPSLKLADLQALLARHQLVIVESGPDGGHFGLAPIGVGPNLAANGLAPTAAGANGVAIGLSPLGAASASLAARDRLLAELRNESGVLMAEPIGPAP